MSLIKELAKMPDERECSGLVRSIWLTRLKNADHGRELTPEEVCRFASEVEDSKRGELGSWLEHAPSELNLKRVWCQGQGLKRLVGC